MRALSLATLLLLSGCATAEPSSTAAMTGYLSWGGGEFQLFPLEADLGEFPGKCVSFNLYTAGKARQARRLVGKRVTVTGRYIGWSPDTVSFTYGVGHISNSCGGADVMFAAQVAVAASGQ